MTLLLYFLRNVLARCVKEIMTIQLKMKFWNNFHVWQSVINIINGFDSALLFNWLLDIVKHLFSFF